MAYVARGHALYAPCTCASRLGCRTVYLARRLLMLERPHNTVGRKFWLGRPGPGPKPIAQ